jgi:hypothetical protein
MSDICDIEEHDGIYTFSSRRIIRDLKISEARKEAGSSGGKASRNTRTKKLYDSPGFLYLVMDLDKAGEYKVGISKDPDKRLSGIRRSYKRENIAIVFKWPVPDMGNFEDSILEYYKDVRDGEWIYMDVPPETLRNEVSSLIQKQTDSKTKPKEYQNTEYDNDIEYDNENGIELKLKESLNEIYIDQQRPKWSHIDFDFELNSFLEKVRGSPDDYLTRDNSGIKLAFQYQLRNAKKKINGSGKQTNKGTEHAAGLVAALQRDRDKLFKGG